jgi:hypothetical protein
MKSLLEHPHIVSMFSSEEEDPCETLESIRRRNHFNYDAEELNQVRMLIDQVVKEFETAAADHLIKFAVRIYDYNSELFVHLVRLSPTLVHASIENETALHWAASWRLSDVPILIELGASINKLSDQNETPLDKAYWHQNEMAVRILLKNGASTMIGKREWLSNKKPHRSIEERLIQRSYYIFLISRMKLVLNCHLRTVVNMLA